VCFEGPLFIVGMPRSGTTLLKRLLCAHPNIRMPRGESSVIPWYSGKMQKFGNLSDIRDFKKFYDHITRSMFFQANKKNIIPLDVWYSSAGNFSCRNIFEALLFYYTGKQNKGDGIVWGDKSPVYMIHMPALKQIFPDARFVHIIRDVRDHALSVRNTWGKNPFRAAYRWNGRVLKAHAEGYSLNRDENCYIEIKYEELLRDTTGVLENIFDFLQLPFEKEKYLKGGKGDGVFVDMKNKKFVDRKNTGKYDNIDAFNEDEISRIEAIAKDAMRECGYVTSGKKGRDISVFTLAWYTITDYLVTLRLIYRKFGIRKILPLIRPRF